MRAWKVICQGITCLVYADSRKRAGYICAKSAIDADYSRRGSFKTLRVERAAAFDQWADKHGGEAVLSWAETKQRELFSEQGGV
jgi:hypothetical protein